MHGPDGVDYPNESIFTEVVKPERIAFTHKGEGGRKGESCATFEANWTFENLGNKTGVTIRLVFPSAEVRDRVAKEYGAVEGAEQTLVRLDVLLSKGSA